MIKIKRVLFVLGGCLLMIGCASRNDNFSGESHFEGLMLTDSLKVKMDFEWKNGDGKTENLSAVLFAVFGKRYRLELSTVFGISVASLLWNSENWVMTFPTEKKYIQGNGDFIEDSSGDFPSINIHRMVSFLWGDFAFFLKDTISIDRDSSQEQETITGRDELKQIQKIGKKFDGRILWVETLGLQGKERVNFGPLKPFGLLWFPSTLTFFREDEVFLTLKIKNVKKNESWSSGIWNLPIPESFQPYS